MKSPGNPVSFAAFFVHDQTYYDHHPKDQSSADAHKQLLMIKSCWIISIHAHFLQAQIITENDPKSVMNSDILFV